MNEKRLKLKALYIELTEKCNLHCIHCYNDSGEGTTEIEKEVLFSLINCAKKMNVDTFSLSGGEPLMSKSLLPVVSEITSNHFKKINIITNGLLLNAKKLEEILKINKNINFQLSLDGIGFSHDIIRGKGTFCKLNEAVNLLQENRCSFVFHSLIHKSNLEQINEMIDYAERVGATQIDFAFLKRKGRGKTNYDSIALSCDEVLQIFKKYVDSDEIVRNKRIDINFPKVFYGSCPLFGDDGVDVFARIDSFGNVYICQNFVGSANVLGNIYNEELQDIITDSRIKEQQKRFALSTKYSKCDSCFLNSLCGRGCPGIEYTDYDDFEESFDCHIRKKYALEKILLFHSGIGENKTMSEDLKNDNTCY